MSGGGRGRVGDTLQQGEGEGWRYLVAKIAEDGVKLIHVTARLTLLLHLRTHRHERKHRTRHGWRVRLMVRVKANVKVIYAERRAT